LERSDSGSIVDELEVVIWKKGFFGVRKERRGDSVDIWNHLAGEIRGNEREEREVKGRDTTETRTPKKAAVAYQRSWRSSHNKTKSLHSRLENCSDARGFTAALFSCVPLESSRRGQWLR
jgi:hypothetical protein